MSGFQRFNAALSGFFLLIVSAIMIFHSDSGYSVVLALLTLSLLLGAVRQIHYYIIMARFMVGGWRILLQGVIVFDIAIVTASMVNIPGKIVMIYLIVLNIFNGVIDILKARETKKAEGGSWKIQYVAGCIEFVISAAALVFINSLRAAVIVYCTGLVYSGILKIISAFRKPEVVYIQ
jgi:uncharacterized membrane protein HdeD (DUF308 family)